MNLPEITVVICSYNHAKFIERCLRSINHQVHIQPNEYEIIVVDDGSTDNTQDIIQNLNLSNLRLIQNKCNIGLPASLNTAIRLARGRFVVRVDSDDYIARNCLYLMRLFLESNREYQAVASDYVLVNEQEQVICKVNGLAEEIACGVMFRKECLFEVGLYNDEFQMREGHELRRRFLERFNIGRLEFPLYKYRQHEGNRTKDVEQLSKYNEKLGV